MCPWGSCYLPATPLADVLRRSHSSSTFIVAHYDDCSVLLLVIVNLFIDYVLSSIWTYRKNTCRIWCYLRLQASSAGLAKYPPWMCRGHGIIKTAAAQAVVAHVFNPQTREAEAGGSFVSLRPTWSTEQVPGQPGLLLRELQAEGTNAAKALRSNS